MYVAAPQVAIAGQRAETHGLTLTAEGNDLRVSGAVTVEVGMILTANKSRILKLLQIRNRGKHDGALSQGVCMTAQRAAAMSEGNHIGFSPDRHSRGIVERI